MHQQATIFYSWQSDLPNSIGRTFIERALGGAIKALGQSKELTLEAAIDRDTKGMPGAPDIGDAILEKIAASAVFVADVSIVTRQAGPQRASPNPNVLLETGYALRCLGPERLILLFNSAVGRVEELPFDLRGRRVLTYNVPEDSNDKAPLRQQLEAQLRAALLLILPLARPAKVLRRFVSGVSRATSR